jgi:hypothetical protein
MDYSRQKKVKNPLPIRRTKSSASIYASKKLKSPRKAANKGISQRI